MSIQSIEVMCIPCPKCEQVKQLITNAIKQIEIQNKIKIVYNFQHTTNFLQADRYSVNASQAPIVIINGNVEFSGKTSQDLIKKRLEALHRY